MGEPVVVAAFLIGVKWDVTRDVPVVVVQIVGCIHLEFVLGLVRCFCVVFVCTFVRWGVIVIVC